MLRNVWNNLDEVHENVKNGDWEKVSDITNVEDTVDFPCKCCSNNSCLNDIKNGNEPTCPKYHEFMKNHYK